MANDDRRGTSVKAAVARTRWQRRKKIATRRTIRDTALRLFDEYGYDRVTMQRVAEEAGMSAITAFRYFPTKEELVIGFPTDGELFTDLRHEMEERPGGSPADFVRRMVPQVLGDLEPDRLEELERRLRIVRANGALRAALYARVPEWTEAVAATWTESLEGIRGGRPTGDAGAYATGRKGPGEPGGFAVRLSVSLLIDCAVETLLEWSRLCDTEEGRAGDKVDLLTSVVSDAMDAMSDLG